MEWHVRQPVACLQAGLLLLLLAVPPTPGLKDFRLTTKNVTSTLDNLLATGRYDKRIRPDMGGPPTQVTVSIYVKSMSSVSETEQKYSMDTYFRQSWYDPRLKFSLPGLTEFSMSWLFLERVWKPDTFILNGHKSYLHRITVPNKFLRVRADGFMTYSMRVTLQASCPMHLRKFPLDSQSCPLFIGSFGYTSSDLVYSWHPTTVGLEPGVELAQYDLVNITTTPNQFIMRGTGEYSMISATFHLRRNTGYYTLQVFVPCGLIVCCSWVSFWIDPDAVPARVSLAVTTVLSMTTMGFGGRAQMPRVNYATALDWFVIVCFAFVFAVMVEYAVINFIDKVTSDIRRILEERKKNRKVSSTESAKSHQDVNGVELDPLATPNSQAPLAVPEGRSRSASMDVVVNAAVSARRLVSRTAQRFGRRSRDRDEAIYAEPSTPGNSLSTPTIPSSPTSQSSPTTAPMSSPPIVVTDLAADSIPNHRTSSAVTPEDEIVYADQQTLSALRDPQQPPEAQESSDYLVPIEGLLRPAESSVDFLHVPDVDGVPGLRRSPSLRRCLSAPYRLWEHTRILPNEADVTRLMQSEEEPVKFSKIDIVARRVFPIAFCSVMILYWVMYGYYITDRFPGDEDRGVMFELSDRQPKKG